MDYSKPPWEQPPWNDPDFQEAMKPLIPVHLAFQGMAVLAILALLVAQC